MCFPLTLSKNIQTNREGRSLATWGSLQSLRSKYSDHVAQLSISSVLFSKRLCLDCKAWQILANIGTSHSEELHFQVYLV